MARLAWALGRTLGLVRLAYTALGKPSTEIVEIEAALAQARLPDEYVELARRIAQIAGPVLTPTPQTSAVLGAAVITMYQKVDWT